MQIVQLPEENSSITSKTVEQPEEADSTVEAAMDVDVPNGRSITVEDDEDDPKAAAAHQSINVESDSEDDQVTSPNDVRKSITVETDSEEEDLLSAPSHIHQINSDASGGTSQVPATPDEPQIIWSEDLDDDDTLAVSDDDLPSKRSGDDVVEIMDEATVPRRSSRRNKRPNTPHATINISDDEEVSDDSKRPKLNAATVGDDDAIIADVLATFNDEMSADFVKL